MRNNNDLYCLFIVSPCDGKQRIVDLTRVLSEEVKEHRIELDKIDFNLVDSFMNSTEYQTIKYPHPEFVIKLDNSLVMQGYSPWHLRYAEICQTYKLKGFNFSTFFGYFNHVFKNKSKIRKITKLYYFLPL